VTAALLDSAEGHRVRVEQQMSREAGGNGGGGTISTLQERACLTSKSPTIISCRRKRTVWLRC